MRGCVTHDLGSYAQGQGRDQVRGQNHDSTITQNYRSKFNETSQKDRT